MKHIAAALAVCVTVFSTCPLQSAEPRGKPLQAAGIVHGDLSVLFRDNSESPKVLSGVQSLLNMRSAPTYDAFDPAGKGSSAGLNFEHIISGHRNEDNKFTPRHGEYALYQTTARNTFRLVRDRDDSPWNISSTLDYTPRKPHAIDFEFRATPHDAKLFGKRGYAIFFFANYMNDVEDVAFNFRGIDKPGGKEKWIRAAAPNGHRHWNSGGTYRHRDAADLKYDDDQKFVLNNWSYNYPRYTKPFYFGKAAHGMVLLMMFDRTHSKEDEIRFSLFKFKVPKHPRPAWDFQYVVHKMKDEKKYGFRGRLVWKKFVSADDCLKDYETWVKTLKPRR